MYARNVVGAIRAIGRGAGVVSRYSKSGSQFARRLGTGAGEFRKSPLGSAVVERSPLASRVVSGIEKHSPAVSSGLSKLGQVAEKLQGLENVQLVGN